MSLKEQLLKINPGEAISLSETEIKARIETMLNRVFTWLAISLLIAFGVAYGLFYAVKQGILNPSYMFPIFIGSAILAFILVVVISWLWQKFSYKTLAVLFIIFSILEGFGLSGIFFVYQMNSILLAFALTSALFLGLVFVGNVLKVDISRWSTVLLVALVVLMIGAIINLFLGNSTLDLILTVAFIVVFSLLVILDINIIKQAALVGDKRMEIVMALALYLDFINLFLEILKLIGRSED
jgi:FtsH-binding integral membrane protein